MTTSTFPTERTVHDGARFYSRLLLAIYDVLIMGLFTPYVWRCKPRHYLELYKKYMSRNHADVGVGTGYVLDKCHYQPGQVRIGLFDLQENCLDYTAKRLERFKPEVYQRNALEPIHIKAKGFDSIALGGILHCIPGDLNDKGKVFASLQPIMRRSSRVFGYTILNKGVKKTRLSRSVFYLCQKLKVINGINDCASDLNSQLKKHFQQHDLKVIGCVAIFSAKYPRALNN